MTDGPFAWIMIIIALLLIYIFAVNFKAWGLPSLPANGMFDPAVGKTPGQVIQHMILPVLSIAISIQRSLSSCEPINSKARASPRR